MFGYKIRYQTDHLPKSRPLPDPPALCVRSCLLGRTQRLPQADSELTWKAVPDFRSRFLNCCWKITCLPICIWNIQAVRKKTGLLHTFLRKTDLKGWPRANQKQTQSIPLADPGQRKLLKSKPWANTKQTRGQLLGYQCFGDSLFLVGLVTSQRAVERLKNVSIYYLYDHVTWHQKH